MYKAGRERERTRHMFEKIMERRDRLEHRIEGLEAGRITVPKQQERLLGDIDEELVTFIRRKGFACADEVQSHFRYKGKNAASARLNRLCEFNLLEKQQAGRRCTSGEISNACRLAARRQTHARRLRAVKHTVWGGVHGYAVCHTHLDRVAPRNSPPTTICFAPPSPNIYE